MKKLMPFVMTFIVVAVSIAIIVRIPKLKQIVGL